MLYTVFLPLQFFQFFLSEDLLGKGVVLKWEYDSPLDYWLIKSNKRLYPQDARVGGTKIVQEYRKLKSDGNTHNIAEEQEYWGITVYDAEGGKLISKDYDVFKMVREYDSNTVPSRIQIIFM